MPQRPAPWACLLAGLGHAALLYGLASNDSGATAAGPSAIGTAAAHAVTVRLAAIPEAPAAPARLVPPSPTRQAPAEPTDHEPANDEMAEAAESAEAATADLPCGSGRYLAPSALDRPALPRSAPDESLLDGVTPSGLPIRLRLCISESGEVVQVEPVLASESDGDVVERLEAMFRATTFVAARLGTDDVASRMEIEIGFNRTP